MMLALAAAAFDLVGCSSTPARSAKALVIFPEQKEFVARHATRKSPGRG